MNYYLDYMTLSALPEKLLEQYDRSCTGAGILEIGHSLFRGEKEKQDYEKAITYYLEAAEKSMSDACFALGLCYEQGKGVPENSEQADYYFRRAFDLKKQQLCKAMGLEAGRQSETKKNLLNRDFRKIFSASGRISKIRQIVFSKTISQYAFAYYHKDISENGDGSVIGWIEATTLHIESNGMVTAPIDCTELFALMKYVEIINFNEVFDTSRTENMQGMFKGCHNLERLDLNGFNTGKVKNMSFMFSGCLHLMEICGLDRFDTSCVRDMHLMFGSCRAIKSIHVRSFDTRQVRTMEGMFGDCRNLEKADVRGFDVGNIVLMAGMFEGCDTLPENYRSIATVQDFINNIGCRPESEPASDRRIWDRVKVEGEVSDKIGEKRNLLTAHFQYILFSEPGKHPNIEEIIFSRKISENAFTHYHKDISENNDGSVIGWIEDTTLHIESNGIVKAPGDCGELFAHLENVFTIEFNNAFDTSLTEDMNGMFLGCRSLIELEVKGFDTSQVKNMSSMFQSCSNLTQLYLSGFNTSRVEDMSSMFKDCKKLIKLDVSGFDTGHVKNMAFMFRGCLSLTKLDLSGFDTTQVKKMAFMFRGCRKLTEIRLSEKFNTEQVEDMSYMFAECKMLKLIDIRHFNMNNANENNMFEGCDALLPEIKMIGG